MCPYETIQKSNLRLHEATHEKGRASKPRKRKTPTKNKLDEEEKEVGEINADDGIIDDIMDVIDQSDELN